MDTQVQVDDKPMILKGIELILAEPANIRAEAITLYEKFEKENPDKTKEQIQAAVADKIISNYSYYSAFAGGATALTGVIPGLGTVVAMTGGSLADAALSMKFQIEMVMALATVYGHNILIEEEKRICFVVAGLGAINEAAKNGGAQVGTKALVKVIQKNLQGPTLIAVKEIFAKVGVTFVRKSAEKAIPFGVGAVIGFSANKGLSWYIGKLAKKTFESKLEA